MSTMKPVADPTQIRQKPNSLRIIPEAIPAALKALIRWLGWLWVWDSEKHGCQGGWTKPPVNASTGDSGSSTNADTWSSFEDALAAYMAGLTDGIGIALLEEDDLAGIDLDGCVDTATGEVAPWAQAIIERINSYTERSPSGTGIRILVRAKLPTGRRRKRSIEIYEDGRYLTITGHHVPGTPTAIEQRTNEVAAFHAEVFKPEVEPSSNGKQPTRDGYARCSTLTDDEIIRKAGQAANGERFSALFAGDTSAYGGDDSVADLALCSMIAFYAQDPVQIDRIFRGSGLMREKWERADYCDRTIAKALSERGEGNRHYPPSGPTTDWQPTDEDAPPHLTSAGPLDENPAEVGSGTPASQPPLLKGHPAEDRFAEAARGVDFASLTPVDADAEMESLPLLGESGYIICWWGHLLAGYPKMGKTELLFASVCAWAKSGVTILWISEEGEHIWSIRRGKVADFPAGRLRIVFSLGMGERALRKIASEAPEAVIIVDTVRNLFGLKDENDNAQVARALAPWEAALAEKTRIYLHHTTKAGGDHGVAIAGGAAFLGVVDRALELRFDEHDRMRRIIVVHSRISTAPDLMYEMGDGGLKALGDPHAVERKSVREVILGLLDDEWHKRKDLASQLPEPKPSMDTITRALEDLVAAGEAERNPAETKQGATYRYRLAKTSANLTSAGGPIESGGSAAEVCGGNAPPDADDLFSCGENDDPPYNGRGHPTPPEELQGDAPEFEEERV